jgi:tRNA1(Val) A37 N6-methylase TrmN6
MVELTTLFDGKVIVYQPKEGYRFALDSLMLAAFTPAKPYQLVMELGIGVGATSLALAHQHPDIQIHGIELQQVAFEIAKKNINGNGWSDRFQLFHGNLKDRLAPGHTYDHVMMNPPYYEGDSYTDSPFDHKTISHQETDASLQDWINEGHRLLKSRGYLVMVHTSRRLAEIITILNDSFGGIEIFPLWPKEGAPSKRVLIRARKGVKSPSTLYAGLVLHNGRGFTEAVNEIVVGGKKI